MTREEIIDGLQYTIDMFCFNPSTGEVTDKNRLNDESRLTVDACEGAIEIIKALEQEPCGNAIDRAEAIRIASGYCHPTNVAKELAKLPSVNPQEPVYCDRNICIQNEYNGIGCEDCEVAKSQKLCEDTISRQAVLDAIENEYKGKANELLAHEIVNIMAIIDDVPSANPQPCGDAISRENAIIRISWDFPTLEISKVKESLDKLPSVNPQLCEDAISRQAVIDLAKKGVLVSNGNYKSVCKAINELPSVNPTKTGHWIQTNEFFINQDGQFIYKFICSECKSLSYFRKSNKKAIGANACPNCGCRMVNPQERSE